MEGKGPYRIYDPGGSDCQVKDEASSLSYRQLLEENTVLRERMKGLKSLGEGSETATHFNAFQNQEPDEGRLAIPFSISTSVND